VTRSFDDPQLGVAVGIAEHPSVEHWHQVIVAAVDDEERTGGEQRRAGDRP
jgi:hypothetical protein